MRKRKGKDKDKRDDAATLKGKQRATSVQDVAGPSYDDIGATTNFTPEVLVPSADVALGHDVTMKTNDGKADEMEEMREYLGQITFWPY